MNAKRTLYQGFVTLYETLIPASDSSCSPLYPYYSVKTSPQAALVIAINQDNRILLSREYRHAIEKEVYTLPGGFVEEGEDVMTAAIRELQEETGYQSRDKNSPRLSVLGSFFPLPGLLEQKVSVIRIDDVIRNGPKSFEHSERIGEPFFVSKEELNELLSKADCDKGPSFDGVSLAALLLWLSKESPE